MSNNTFATQASCPGGNNVEASGSASRQAQQTKPAVGQDGSGRSGDGAVIGLSAASGLGGPGGAVVGSQVPVSETMNADGREMGDGIPTQSSAAGESDNGKFPMVGEEDLTFKKLAPMAEESIMLISDNGKFIMVDKEDLIFKKISPMTKEIMVEKVVDGWRDTVSYFVEKVVKFFADDE
ncbi:hypothetical protein Tco_1267849 [Tanacetum coccineum]